MWLWYIGCIDLLHAIGKVIHAVSCARVPN